MPIKTPPLIAEFIGTFALCFAGILALAHHGDNLVVVALAHGLAIGTMISAIGYISGGHLNPAVTLGLLVAGKIDGLNAAAYVLAQVLGGLVAAAICLPLVHQSGVDAGTPGVAEGVSLPAALIVEIVLTFFLVFTVYGSAVDKRGNAVGGLFIGLAVTMGILAGGPLTGAAMNPARHLGPALLSGNGEKLGLVWLYWLAPVIGGVLAGGLWRGMLAKPEPGEGTESAA